MKLTEAKIGQKVTFKHRGKMVKGVIIHRHDSQQDPSLRGVVNVSTDASKFPMTLHISKLKPVVEDIQMKQLLDEKKKHKKKKKFKLLIGKQHRLDVDGDKKIEKSDLKKLRKAKKKGFDKNKDGKTDARDFATMKESLTAEMMSDVIKGNSVDAHEKFDSLMAAKVTDLLNHAKVVVANNVFNTPCDECEKDFAESVKETYNNKNLHEIAPLVGAGLVAGGALLARRLGRAIATRSARRLERQAISKGARALAAREALANRVAATTSSGQPIRQKVADVVASRAERNPFWNATDIEKMRKQAGNLNVTPSSSQLRSMVSNTAADPADVAALRSIGRLEGEQLALQQQAAARQRLASSRLLSGNPLRLRNAPSVPQTGRRPRGSIEVQGRRFIPASQQVSQAQAQDMGRAFAQHAAKATSGMSTAAKVGVGGLGGAGVIGGGLYALRKTADVATDYGDTPIGALAIQKGVVPAATSIVQKVKDVFKPDTSTTADTSTTRRRVPTTRTPAAPRRAPVEVGY